MGRSVKADRVVMQMESARGMKKKLLASAVARACMSTSLLLLPTIPANAQSNSEGLEEITVTATYRNNYLVEDTTLGSKLTESLRDTPQNVVTLTQAMMEDRNVLSVDDALRNVPGITLNAGEMRWQGNGPNIRGFDARNDMYVDGIRDIGFYARDPFNLEAIEVIHGPSSAAFGRGSTGGIINQSTKKAFEGELTSLHFNVGNADTKRAVVDVNRSLTENVDFRVNLLAHDAGVPGRDELVETTRYGFAPTLALDLGEATRLNLSYQYMRSDGMADYGLPWVGNKPANVDRSNFYGFDNDWMDTESHVFGAILDHKLNDTFSLNAHVRYGDHGRTSRITEPFVAANVPATADPATVTATRLIFATAGSEGTLQGQVNLRADFATGGIEHALVTGLELSRETADSTFAFTGQGQSNQQIVGTVPFTNLANPVNGDFNSVVPVRLAGDATADTVGVFAVDTLKFSEQWQLVLGLRWDQFETDYEETRFSAASVQTARNQYLTEDREPSYRAAVVYKPVPDGTIYLGWGTSFNPATESVTQIDAARNLTTPNINLEPQENESLELGVKWGLFNNGLLVDTSVFQIKRTNAYIPDTSNPGFNTDSGRVDVKGFSFLANGAIGDFAQVLVGYTYLDGETVNTITGAIGPIANIPENNFNFWVNWSATDKLGIGAGTRYNSERFMAVNKGVEDYWTIDAMAQYQYNDTLKFQLNLTNLTDEYYIDQLHNWHLFPGQGFGAVFAVKVDY